MMSHHLLQSLSYDTLYRLALEAYTIQLKRIWLHLPAEARASHAGLAYGRHLNALIRRTSIRQQSFATLFLRNRAELELMLHLLQDHEPASNVDILVMGCSKGAEVYSIQWVIRTTRPDFHSTIVGVDISADVLAFAECGSYSMKNGDNEPSVDQSPVSGGEHRHIETQTDQTDWLFGHVGVDELYSMFGVSDDRAIVRPFLREGITWCQGDAGDPHLANALGRYDIVLANRFLCHMPPANAERCLLNVARLVKPTGYLFVSGIDLDVRSSVARRMGWTPMLDLIKEVHDGDDTLRKGWPLEYWGLEPFDDSRPDWKYRYASAFQIGDSPLLASHARPHSANTSSKS